MNPENLLKLVEEFKNLISKTFFQGQEPDWLPILINIILVVIFVLLALWEGLIVIGQIVKIWTEQIRPLYYNKEQTLRKEQRQRFAEHIEHELRRLNTREEWQDHRFTELEAEVETEGRRRQRVWLPFKSGQRGLRRESSLSKA